MSKVLDKQIEKEINSGLKINKASKNPLNSYKLPKFDKNDKGEYVFVGNATISTLKDFNKYMETYREISNQLRKVYKPVIAKIYKNALNSLVADNGKFKLSENDYTLSSKLSEDQFTTDYVRDNLSSTHKQTLGYITKAAYNSRRVKPSSAINNLMKSSDKELAENGMVYVLPVMTDNGVVLNQKKQNKTAVEVQFETIPSEDAVAIMNYLIEATNGIEPSVAEQIKAKIEDIFKESKAIGESVRASVDNNLTERLEKLGDELIDLIGVDLSNFDKNNKPAVRKAAKNPANEATSEAPKGTYEASEILMNGSYKTSPSIEDGRIVTKLSPEGMKFLVTLKNNRIFVTNKEAEENSFGQ